MKKKDFQTHGMPEVRQVSDWAELGSSTDSVYGRSLFQVSIR